MNHSSRASCLGLWPGFSICVGTWVKKSCQKNYDVVKPFWHCNTDKLVLGKKSCPSSLVCCSTTHCKMHYCHPLAGSYCTDKRSGVYTLAVNLALICLIYSHSVHSKLRHQAQSERFGYKEVSLSPINRNSTEGFQYFSFVDMLEEIPEYWLLVIKKKKPVIWPHNPSGH